MEATTDSISRQKSPRRAERRWCASEGRATPGLATPGLARPGLVTLGLVVLLLGGPVPATCEVSPGPGQTSARCLLPPPSQEMARDAPNIVLIAADTLRADHLGFLGHTRPVSPHLDRLASESLVWERAIAAAPWTTPSFASLWTGRHPAELGFDREPIKLPPEIPTLGEELSQRGYTTVGVISHFFLGTKFGFDRGFDFWNQEAAGGHDKVSSPQVTELALECLDALAERPAPFFLLAHYFDPHYDYLGHDEFPFHEGYEGSIESHDDNFETLRKLARSRDLSPEDLGHLRDLYDSEIAFTDAAIGRLLDALRSRDLYQDTLIVFVADHGEMFAERTGRWIGHTQFLYDALIHVPLVIKLPGAEPPKGRIRQTVSLVDLLPTLLAQLDPGEPSSRSLLPHPGEGATDRPVFSQTRRWRQLDAVIHGGWKLIHDRRRGELELYDLAKDPLELDNRAGAQPARRDALRALLETWDRYNQRELARLEGVEVPALSQDEIEKLRSLGYIQ